MRGRAAALLLLAPVLAASVCGPAWASGTPGSNATSGATLTAPASESEPPPSYRRSAVDAKRIAGRNEKIRDYSARFKQTEVRAFTKGQGLWQVSWYVDDGEVAQATVNDRSGAVTEAWTGPQVAWTMARGVEGAFGRKLTKPWIWLPLLALFLLPLVNVRRPLRLLHLDLLVLASFSISLYFFNKGEIDISVPLAYPPLIYLFVRMVLASYWRKSRTSTAELDTLVPINWLEIGLMLLVGFRVGLNLIDSNVIDVGYAGVIGADRIAHGEQLYGNFPDDNVHGDTYGPINYILYLPFELAFPWQGRWNDLPAAHGAAVFFDLGTILGLYLVGRRWRSHGFGIVLSYAWAAYPFTLYVSNSNANDSLVAMLLIFGLLALASAPARGALLSLATWAKFVPAALGPLWLTYRAQGERWPRALAGFVLAFVVVTALVFLPLLPGGGLDQFWERTLASQLERESPFSIWGMYPASLGLFHHLVKYVALLFALVVAFLPRRKDMLQLVALSACVLLLAQLALTHWFYLYIVWFLPFVLIACFGRYSGKGSSTVSAP